MDFRQRLEQSRIQLVTGATSPDTDEPITSPYFATERGKNPICLDLRMANGSHVAIPYSYFTEIRFEAETGIEIQTTQKCIRITGRQLSTLYDHLVNYHVRYVQADFGSDAQDEGLYVSGISIEEV